MKKKLIVATLTALTSGIAQADFLRIEAGAGIWQSTPSGSAAYNSTAYDVVDKLGYKEETPSYMWINFKHPIPVLPNVRLEYTAPEFNGEGKVPINWNGQNYDVGATNELQIKQTDIALYYNLLDNTFWATLDLGLNIKVTDISFALSGTSTATGNPLSFNESTTLPIPMLYARTRVQIPTTDIGLEADVKYISYSDITIYDARAKVDYTLDFVPVIQPAIELGYRTQKFQIDSNSIDFNTNVDFSGVYGGLMLRF